MAKPVLYSYYRSSCSWRVRIALALKGIDYEYKAVNILKQANDRGDYHTIHPLATVPSLVIDGNVIPNSTAILEYLEETKKENPLLPDNPVDRSKVRAFIDIIVSGIQPIQNIAVLNHIEQINSTITKKEWGNYYVTKGFKAIEALLNEHSGKYCVGNEITLADVCLVPQVFNAAKFDVDMSQFPKIQKINDDLLKLDAFNLTHPFKQPDCPS